MKCDNCGNDVQVIYCEERQQWECMPCREALERGDQGTFNLRRMYT